MIRAPSLLWINQFALLPGDGGGTRHFELGRELVRRGWSVTVVASDFHLHRRSYRRRSSAGDRRAIVQDVEGVQMRWLWAAPYRANDWRRAWNWLSFARSVRHDAREVTRPDIVIGSSPQLFAARAGLAVARRFGVPFVLEVRDLWPESLVAGGGRRGPGYWLLDSVARRLYRSADRILVLARGTADYLTQRGIAPSRMFHVPNGVDVESVRPVGTPNGDRPFTLVYAGAHGPANGLDIVLDAAEILGRTSSVRFLLVGDGPSKETLRSEAARRRLENVEFRDPVGRDELVSVFAKSDAGLMLLRAAPLFSFAVSPNKLFDYFAAGLPVVCNVPGEVSGLLEDARAGVQTSDTSGAALAEAVRRLQKTDPMRRREMGMSGRRWVERERSRTVLAERLDGHLREVLA